MLAYTLLSICVLGTSVLGQSATTWPPPSTLASSFENKTPLAVCTPTSQQSIPQRWFSGIQAEFANQNSQLSQMIQAACDSSYASSHVSYGSCNTQGGYITCQFNANTAFYNASYTAQSASGQLSSCLNAPFYIQNDCSIASGSGSESSIGGQVSTPFNGPDANQYESYSFTITPNLSFPACDGKTNTVDDPGNVDFALEALCASDSCQELDAVYGCDRNITQHYYTIMAHRQNYGSTPNFNNCVTVLTAIIQQCYEGLNQGGYWALDPTGTQPSQEYYSLSFEPIQDFQEDL